MIARRLIASVIFVLVISIGVQSLAQRPKLKPTVFAIRDAKVVTEPGKELPEATIVIRDGLIEQVGASVSIPADALVLDGKGLIVYPGFIDAGSTWGIDTVLQRSETGPAEPVDLASEALAATKSDNRKGVTPEFEVATALKLEDDTADNYRKAGFTARLAMPDSGTIAGQSALVSLNGTSPREAIIRTPIGLHVSLKAAGGGFGGAYPGTLMGVMAHFRQTLLDAGHLSRLTEAYEKKTTGRRPPRDSALAALLPALQRRQPVVFETDTKDSIHRALDMSDEFQLQPILLGAQEAWKAADRLQTSKTPVIVALNYGELPAGGGRRGGRPPTDPTPQQPADPGRPRRPQPDPSVFEPPAAASTDDSSLPKRVRDDRERKLKEEIKNLTVLQEKGIGFALTAKGLEPAKFQENLRKAIDAGLKPETALRALTTDAARILGAEKQLGVIAAGRPAHVVAMSGPFHEAKSQVRYAFADGVRFEYETTPAADDKPKDEKKADEKKPSEKKPDDTEKPKNEKNEPAKAEQATELEEDRKPKLRTGGNVFIKGGTLVTVANGNVKADLLVRDGKIARMGANLPVPAGVAIIDAAGLFIMPGIIDTHCHFAMSGGINEGTLSVVPEIRCRDIINSEDVQIYRALAGGVTTARLLHGSANVIGGQDAVIKLKYGEPASRLLVHDAPKGVKFALGENVKRTDGRFPNTRLGVEAVLIRAFTEAQAYKQMWEHYRKAKSAEADVPEPRRDLRLEALGDILDGKVRVHSHCYRADEILMLLRVADKFGFKVKSLQHVLEGYKIAPEIAAHGASCSTFSDWWAYKIEAFDAIPYNAALLKEAGAEICMKSDSNELMRHLYQEAAKAMKYGGMSETDALKTITLNGAKQLGLENRTGTIEAGKDADLAIFNAHPLNSYARCEWTLVEGEVYFQRPNGVPRPNNLAWAPPAAARGAEQPVCKFALSPSKSYVLQNVTVHPVVGDAEANTSVVITNGKIMVIDTNFPVAAGATFVDCKGLHVYPGMIDAGTVLGLTELGSARETQDFAEGGDFQPDLRAAIGINPDSELIPVTRANGVLTVVTRPTGALIPGQSALINLNGWVPSEMVIVDPLMLHIDFPGVLPVMMGTPSSFNLGRAIAKKQRDEKIRKTKELFAQAVAYDKARQANASAQAVDPRLEALVPYATGKRPVIFQANRKDDIVQAIKLADELKVKMILSGGIDAWKVTDELKKKDIPVILGPVMLMPQDAFDPYDAPFTCAAKLHQAGVKFCIRNGTDGSTNTRNLPYEAAMAISYGLPPEEGLKAVTLYPAQILGVADRLGSIEQGKIANLVLTDGDILQATTQVHALFINGVPLEPTSKQTRLYERYRQRLKEVKDGKAGLGTK